MTREINNFVARTISNETNAESFHHLIYIYSNMYQRILAASLRCYKHGDQGACEKCHSAICKGQTNLHYMGRLVYARQHQ